jgi:hypothetical protein
MESILKAMKNESAHQGAGGAVVKYHSEDTDGSKAPVITKDTWFAKFTFKGERSRTETHKYDEAKGTVGDRRRTDVDTGERYAQFTTVPLPFLVLKTSDPVTRFKMGRDFRPESFTNMGAIPTAEVMVREMKYHDCEVTETDDGLVKLTIYADRGDPKRVVNKGISTYTFDPAKGYSLVEVHREGTGIREENRGASYSSTLRLTCQQTSGGWYPKTAVLDWVSAGEDPSYLLTHHMEIEVKDFDATAIPSDNDFTVESLHVPDGATVYDVETKMWSLYGQPRFPESQLPGFLRDVRLSDEEAPAVSDEGAATADAPSQVQEQEPSQPIALETRPRRWWPYVATACATLAAVILCATYLRRRKSAS